MGRGLIGLDVRDINMVETRQMCEIKERIAHVLNTHRNEELKNEYLTDEELEMIHAILHVFTKEAELETKSAFTDALKELKSSPKQDANEESETLIKGGPGGYPTDYPIKGESALC